MMIEKKAQALKTAIADFRSLRLCSPSDDPDEQTSVTSSFRHVTIQLQRLAGPILPADTAGQLAAINVEMNDLYLAYDANSEISALLPDIEEAIETAKRDALDTSNALLTDLPFSRRNNFAPTRPPEIIVREDAPEYIRMVMLDKPLELGFRPNWLRTIVCRVLRERPDPDNWSEFPNVWGEVEHLGYSCPWFEVYDIIEAIHKEMLNGSDPSKAKLYAAELNEAFAAKGVGWQLAAGRIVTRGNDAFERTVRVAEAELSNGGRTTAATRIGKAVQALSSRPTPDTSGAISHATSAMECVLDDITGQHMTLGDFLKRHSTLFDGSVKKALEGLWGFASECGARHGREGIEPSRDDAEFVVSIAAATSAYLNRKTPRPKSEVDADMFEDEIPF